MPRTFSSIGQFVSFMSRQVATLPAAQHHALAEGADIVLKEARDYPGHYQKGWDKLQPETIARKATGDSPLLESGGLRDSYAAKVSDPHHAAVGSDDEKAVWQELGTSRGIPPRPVLALAGVTKEQEVVKAIAHVIARHMTGGSNA